MTGFEYPYRGYWGRPAKCGLEVYRHENFTLVIATELNDNPGTSITNMAEPLATEVCKDLGVPARSMVWVEHYPGPARGLAPSWVKEHWDLTQFYLDVPNGRFLAPAWFRLSVDQVEQLKAGAMPEGLR